MKAINKINTADGVKILIKLIFPVIVMVFVLIDVKWLLLELIKSTLQRNFRELLETSWKDPGPAADI